MSITVSNSFRRVSEHFEPDPALDPLEQRKLRGHLDQIDFATYAANREVLSQAFGRMSLERFERLAVAAAHARANWVAAALATSETSPTLSPEQAAQLNMLRGAYQELADAYEALRRMVERGYLSFQAASA
jgi:hypothetical protein